MTNIVWTGFGCFFCRLSSSHISSHHFLCFILSRSKIFDKVRELAPEQLTKIRLIKGDIAQENMDMDEGDVEELANCLNIIFHCAAKAKFSLTLREALNFNTCGTLRVLQLAAKIKHLEVFSHISTSYCCPNEKVFEERHHPACEDPYTVIKLLKSSRESDLDDEEPRWVQRNTQKYFFAISLCDFSTSV